jgi:phage recombination protein Bet
MNAVSTAVAQMPNRATSVVVRMAERFGVDPDKMMGTLKATAFKGEVSNEQMMALLVVADSYGLNPWTKEIYAFPDKNNGIVPVVGVDGWSRIINSHPQFDGIDFEQDADSCTCTIHRKDRGHPIRVTEYFRLRRHLRPRRSRADHRG